MKNKVGDWSPAHFGIEIIWTYKTECNSVFCVPTSPLWMASSAMSQQVVQVQPQSRVQEAGQWSTGLCECYKDVGDCECSDAFSLQYDTKYDDLNAHIWLSLLNAKTVFPELSDGLKLTFTINCNIFLYCELIYFECVSCVSVCAGCFALCCLPVFTCKVTNAVGACPCLPLLDCIGCVPPASLAMRASVRQRYGIQVTQT